MSGLPFLTVSCITYNQEKFIRQTLDGFVMQKTDFPFIVYVADDHSSDRTPDIIREYAEKYPAVIHPILREKNLGAVANSKDVSVRIQSKYAAGCEGDDYWTDPLKLQKQVDFLESHPECSMCFHQADILYEDLPKRRGKLPKTVITPSEYRYFSKLGCCPAEYLCFRNPIPTAAGVHRWIFPDDSRPGLNVPDDILPGDWFIHLLYAAKGKIGFLPENMSVYRVHASSIWSANSEEQRYLKYSLQICRFAQQSSKIFEEDSKEYKIMNSAQSLVFSKCFSALAKNGEVENMKRILMEFPEESSLAMKRIRILHPYQPLSEASAIVLWFFKTFVKRWYLRLTGKIPMTGVYCEEDSGYIDNSRCK